MKSVELCPRCPSAKPTPPASHGLVLDEDRTGRGERREGDKVYYRCAIQ